MNSIGFLDTYFNGKIIINVHYLAFRIKITRIKNRNYHAPVTKMLEDGITVLDSGCGPATWTFEMGETFPKSSFYGIDVSSIFPEAIKPANVELSVANITKNVPFPDNTFDYIHQRLLFAALTDSNWDSVRN
jgi:ubiquinone/menaquinone biosynthesis C-methylase UbiE